MHDPSRTEALIRGISPEIMGALQEMGLDYQCGSIDEICIIGFKDGGVPQFYNTIEDLDDLTTAVDCFRIILAEDEESEC